jgi:hypothetical protein
MNNINFKKEKSSLMKWAGMLAIGTSVMLFSCDNRTDRTATGTTGTAATTIDRDTVTRPGSGYDRGTGMGTGTGTGTGLGTGMGTTDDRDTVAFRENRGAAERDLQDARRNDNRMDGQRNDNRMRLERDTLNHMRDTRNGTMNNTGAGTGTGAATGTRMGAGQGTTTTERDTYNRMGETDSRGAGTNTLGTESNYGRGSATQDNRNIRAQDTLRDDTGFRP